MQDFEQTIRYLHLDIATLQERANSLHAEKVALEDGTVVTELRGKLESATNDLLVLDDQSRRMADHIRELELMLAAASGPDTEAPPAIDDPSSDTVATGDD